MSTVSETERAIEYFKQYETYLGNKISEYLSKSFNSVGEYTEELTKEKSVYSLAITAIRKQSEAERKIEKVREYCEYTSGEFWAVNILEILEGTTDV